MRWPESPNHEPENKPCAYNVAAIANRQGLVIYGLGSVDADAAAKLASSFTAPAGRRSANLKVAGPASTADAAVDGPNKLKNYRSTLSFANGGAAVSGQLQVDIMLTNVADLPINPGLLQFEIVNTATGTSSILLPAFTAWYAGGKLAPLPRNAEKAFRFHANASCGESLAGPFEVRVRSFETVPGGTTHDPPERRRTRTLHQRRRPAMAQWAAGLPA